MLKINLYHGRKKRKIFREGAPKIGFEFPSGDRVVVGSLVAVGILILLILFSFFYNRHTIGKLDDAITVAVADSVRYAESIRLYNEINDRKDWIRDRIDVIQLVDQNRYLWSKLMSSISDAIPSATWITRIETVSPFPNLMFRIDGVSFSNIEVANFMRSLETLEYIDEVRLISTREFLIDGIPTMAFAMECSHGKGPGPAAGAGGEEGDAK